MAALKDGWVPGPDGLWAVNSSGIVTLGGETYLIAVHTQHLSALERGWRRAGDGLSHRAPGLWHRRPAAGLGV